MSKHSQTVYSTEQGRLCPGCGYARQFCQCHKQQSGGQDGRPASDGIVRLRRETKGRKGKGVTIVEGLPMSAAELKSLAKELKARCGSGGTVRDGNIEIQGEHRESVKHYLDRKGIRNKVAGG